MLFSFLFFLFFFFFFRTAIIVVKFAMCTHCCTAGGGDSPVGGALPAHESVNYASGSAPNIFGNNLDGGTRTYLTLRIQRGNGELLVVDGRDCSKHTYLNWVRFFLGSASAINCIFTSISFYYHKLYIQLTRCQRRCS